MTDKPVYPVRKRIRLDHQIYAQPGTIISQTVGTQDRRPVFADSGCTENCLDILQTVANNHSIHVIVYCFMPDHLHLLLDNTRGADLVTFMRQFKSWTTRAAWAHGWRERVWQRSYYDHVLREHEDIAGHIRYILGNPVRAGLVEYWREHPWSGSFVYDFSDPADWPS